MLKDEVKTAVSNDVIAAQATFSASKTKREEADQLRREVEKFGLHRVEKLGNTIGKPKPIMKHHSKFPRNKKGFTNHKLKKDSNIYKNAGGSCTVVINNQLLGCFKTESEAKSFRDEHRHKHNMEPCPGSKYYDEWFS